MPKLLSDNYFYSTKRTRNGIIVILSLVILCSASAYIYKIATKSTQPKEDYSAQIAVLRALQPDTSNNYNSYASDRRPYQQYERKQYDYQQNNDRENASVSLFYFDPNTITVDEWKRLGVKEKTANSVQKYISKGGKFRQPEDIKKIWGISPEKMEQLVPYVKITSIQPYEKKGFTPYAKTEYQPYEKKKPQNIDINSADTIAFASLPGIGAGYARRIAKFRDRLGGFYSIDQVAETFGLPDSTYQKIKPFLQLSSTHINKLNINTATEDDLKAHPYIRWQYAKVIVAYRGQHGNFSAVEDLKKIMSVTAEDYNKIKNYVVVN